MTKYFRTFQNAAPNASWIGRERLSFGNPMMLFRLWLACIKPILLLENVHVFGIYDPMRLLEPDVTRGIISWLLISASDSAPAVQRTMILVVEKDATTCRRRCPYSRMCHSGLGMIFFWHTHTGGGASHRRLDLLLLETPRAIWRMILSQCQGVLSGTICPPQLLELCVLTISKLYASYSVYHTS